MSVNRIDQLTTLLPAYNLDCVAVIPGATLQYLTGLTFHLMERPIVAFFCGDRPPAIVAPEFECAKLNPAIPWQVFPWNDAAGVEGAFAACCQSLGIAGMSVGVEELVMRVKENSLLNTFASGVTISPADSLITAMRLQKDAAEIKQMKAAVAMVETVLADTLPALKIGMTEKQVAAELMIALLRAGSDTLPFEPLVQTGQTGAAPHATAGDRRLAAGDLLIIDFGARSGGYVSDITRTFAVGEVDEKSRRIFELVRQANQAGREIAAPGIPCQEVDRAARRVIDRGGFGQYFTHRTGHGIGLDGHEPPYMVEGNTQLLEPGMAFTVEPGIYLPGFGGVRIEDDLIVTQTAAESLTTFSRELRVIG